LTDLDGDGNGNGDVEVDAKQMRSTCLAFNSATSRPIVQTNDREPPWSETIAEGAGASRGETARSRRRNSYEDAL